MHTNEYLNKPQKFESKTSVKKLTAKDRHKGIESKNINGSLAARLFYYLTVLFISIVAFNIYFYWLDAYKYSHPEVFQAQSGVYAEEIPFEGVLLWEERIVFAGTSGTISYPSQEPRRVRKGEQLCKINGVAQNSPDAGYFIPAFDGYEGNWNYSDLWPGTSALPSPAKATPIPDGIYVDNKQPIGKLIPQPQELRAIAWIDVTPSLNRDISRNRIKIRRSENDWGVWAEIRTKANISQRTKIYVTLPFFTPEMAEIRTFSWKIYVGEQNGIYVPNSSVILKDGVMGVYIIKGNEAIFRKVEAFHVDEDTFFINSGVIPGDMLILNAGSAREGEVSIW
ncbi:MAG: hypothetical protein FWF87_06945 [Synergistaceae bacterium]|nr:hypothetical protein [Synergistaceae bacterium]